MIGSIVGLALSTAAEKTRAQVTADVNYQGEAVMSLITQTIHQASSINSPTSGNSGTSLSLSMSNSAVNPTTFILTNDGTTSRFQIGEGAPAINNNLTNARVVVSNLNFTNMSLSGTKGSVLIKYTITYRTPSPRQELQYSKTFYGAATIP